MKNKLPDEMIDKLLAIIQYRNLMDRSYVKTAISLCRLYKKHGYLDFSKKRAFDRIAEYSGYYSSK